MSVTAPETEARQQLITILQNEFAAEQFSVRGDYLHESLGAKNTIIGVSPTRTSPSNRDSLVNEMNLFVQFYGKYNLKIDPTQSVDPTVIETYAERFRQALQAGISRPGSGSLWYFDLTVVNYPNDPTGNKSRFEATVVARGNNSALVESVI